MTKTILDVVVISPQFFMLGYAALLFLIEFGDHRYAVVYWSKLIFRE